MAKHQKRRCAVSERERDELIDIVNQEVRRRLIRWIVLDALNHGRPFPIAESIVLSVIRGLPMQCTALELRCELAYLEICGCLVLSRHEGAPWTAELTRAGIDIADYTVEVEPGIARPTRERFVRVAPPAGHVN
jgi:hypothetical protein